MPPTNVTDVFHQSQFDSDLHTDLRPVLVAAAAMALPALAGHFATPAVLGSPAPSEIAAQTATRLIEGGNDALGINEAIGRDLQTTLQSAIADHLPVSTTLTRVASTLGVQIDTGGVPLATQDLGSRALLIANNASHQMTNTLATDVMKIQGVVTKGWQSMGDDAVRASHQDADDQYSDPDNFVGIDDTFSVGGEDLRYPGDPAGSAAETYNCRCVVIPGEAPSTTQS